MADAEVARAFAAVLLTVIALAAYTIAIALIYLERHGEARPWWSTVALLCGLVCTMIASLVLGRHGWGLILAVGAGLTAWCLQVEVGRHRAARRRRRVSDES